MKKNLPIIILIVALVALAVVVAVLVVKSNAAPLPATAQNTKTMPSEVTDDESKFATLMGDAYDEAFIADMLAHHEGAVNMAEQAQAMTARDEIRELAEQIVYTQSREMAEMHSWQAEWGYDVTNAGGHMNHGGGGADMAGDMAEMQNSLAGLQGEAYDRMFLRQMILHHEQAVVMSRYAETNAKHQELKDLAADVITAQQQEIDMMKRWQAEWGY